MSDKLLSCPFCGSDNCRLDNLGGESYTVICDTCRTCIGFYTTQKGAAEAWNKRSAQCLKEGMFLLPVPRRRLIGKTETSRFAKGSGEYVTTYEVITEAVVEWAACIDQAVLDKLCEANGYVERRTCLNDALKSDQFICTECHKYYDIVDMEDNDWSGVPNYCPNCGAKVVGHTKYVEERKNE